MQGKVTQYRGGKRAMLQNIGIFLLFFKYILNAVVLLIAKNGLM